MIVIGDIEKGLVIDLEKICYISNDTQTYSIYFVGGNYLGVNPEVGRAIIDLWVKANNKQKD